LRLDHQGFDSGGAGSYQYAPVSSSPPIIAALSGGVDSAVAAAMLCAAGHRVVGITMRLYDARGARGGSGRCCGPRDIEDARRVCHHLGIPFYVVDFEEEFSRRVVDDFVAAYLAGETPNPCVRCNQYIKFTPLLRRARSLGAEQIATGHYARLERGEDGQVRLRRARDAGKDQSYFLFSMPRGELGSVLFPLGDLDKREVRARAAAYGLPNAEKADSQEICFVPDGDYAGFVERAAAARGSSAAPSGPILDESGAEVGTHAGLHRFTVGQRRGLGNLNQSGRPAYVLRLLPEKNAVVIGEREQAAQRELSVRDARWLVDLRSEEFSALVQVRHRAAPVSALVVRHGTTARVHLDHAMVAAPGQAAVFYQGDIVLGGGWLYSA
jgi:tRNA-specific 2-thiouridylase